jgi:PAS domain S-box-containing protein
MNSAEVSGHRVRPFLMWLLAPIAPLVLSIVVLVALGTQGISESGILVAAFNALFCSAASIIIAFLAARDYLASSSPSLLFLGSGALVFGLAYFIGGSLVSHPDWAITIQSIGTLAAGALFLSSGAVALAQKDGARGAANRAADVSAVYLGSLVFTGLLTAAATTGLIPNFWTATQGPTAPREVVLGLAVICFVVASTLFTHLYRRQRARFPLLCSAAFALIAVSLGALVLTMAPSGSPISWIARTGQWLGGVYLLVAVFSLAERSIWTHPLERNLRELEERYRTLVDMSPDPIIVDAEGKYLFANPAAAHMLGLAFPEELVGREIADFVAPEDLEVVARRRGLAIDGVPSSPQEITLKRMDGTLVYVETMDRRVRFQGRLAAQVIMRDITERRRAAEALRESEERYRLLAKDNERLYRQQLDIAESLQSAFLNIPSEIGRVKLGHLYRSATEAALVGGDFYDAFEVKHQIVVLMGDVSGHGIQAARTATLVKDVVHAFTHQTLRTHEVLKRTNGLLVEKNLQGFVTLFLGILDGETGRLQYSSAGHPEALLRRASGQVESLDSGSSPLGIFPDTSWKSAEVEIQADDLLLLYTDGVIEARNGDEFFGEKRLRRLLRRKRVYAERLPQFILDEVLAFSGGILKDDIGLLTLSLVGVVSPPKPRGGYKQETLLD